MAFISVPGVAAVNVRWLLFGELCENRLHFKHIGDPGVDDMNELCLAVGEWWIDYVKPHTSADVTLQEIVARGLSSVVDAAGSAAVAPGTAGSVGSASNPSHLSYSVPIKTGAAGRSARGRIAFGGLAEIDVAANNLSVIRSTGFRAAVTALIGPGVVYPGWTFGIVSYKTAGLVNNPGVFRAATQLGAGHTRVGSQNSRKPGRGQ